MFRCDYYLFIKPSLKGQKCSPRGRRRFGQLLLLSRARRGGASTPGLTLRAERSARTGLSTDLARHPTETPHPPQGQVTEAGGSQSQRGGGGAGGGVQRHFPTWAVLLIPAGGPGPPAPASPSPGPGPFAQGPPTTLDVATDLGPLSPSTLGGLFWSSRWREVCGPGASGASGWELVPQEMLFMCNRSTVMK